MTKEQKDKWVEALRSGKFIQGTGRLTTIKNGVEEDCCMGVFCKVMNYPIGRILEWAEDFSAKEYKIGNESVRHYLPDPILSEEISRRLGEMNDRGATFSEIADWIEQYVNCNS